MSEKKTLLLCYFVSTINYLIDCRAQETTMVTFMPNGNNMNGNDSTVMDVSVTAGSHL